MAAPEQPQTQLGQQLVCPDPSAHEHHQQPKRLQEQSANAALYVTHPERATNVRDINALGPDGKLSSAGAATSLKYARAQDLPSYPSVGIDTKNSGLTAASLAHANPKDIRWPTPDISPDANKAANLANGYKMAPLWRPEASAAGSKAAMLAHQGKGGDWRQPTASKDGLQAATLATRNKNLGPQLDYGYTEDGRSKALLAATLSVKGRKRTDSTSELPIAQNGNSKSNSLKAATMAHADGINSRAIEQSRLTHARNLSRDMYTEHPNVDIEKKEKAHQDALKGASISMAKKMYAMEQVDDQGHVRLSAGQAAARTASRTSTDGTTDLKSQALQYLTLQAAAQRLAAERLAKIEDQHEPAALRDYYGYSNKRRSRLTLKGRNRRRASSESAAPYKRSENAVEELPTSSKPHRRNLDIDSDDEEQAAKVRSQMNTFNTKLAEADKKRLGDRERLLAAAERKVQAQMSEMDEKVFNETGKMSPAMMEDWDNRARAKAAAASQVRMHNHGKVDIGGGKFLDQSEIDAIALANIKPTLDEINDTAEKQRARDEEIRLERDEQRRQTLKERERNAENKVLAKKMKAEDKDAERKKQRDGKIAAKHEKTAIKEERQREREAPRKEQERGKETVLVQGDAIQESHASKLEKQNEREFAYPVQKKSPWKKLIPGNHERKDRDPGKLSTDGSRYEEVSPAIVAKLKPSRKSTDGVEITPTDATMAGDTPATVAAPEILPETEAAIDAQATTPIEERTALIPPLSSESRRIDSEESEDAASPASPSKKRFSRLIGKLKRIKRDSTKRIDAASTSSFAGGAKLHKQRQVEDRTASEASGAPVPAPVLAASDERSSFPSISSLSSDDEQEVAQYNEERGRSATRLEVVARQIADTQHSTSEGEDTDTDFVDASDLAPPPQLLSKKTESPVRESVFREAL